MFIEEYIRNKGKIKSYENIRILNENTSLYYNGYAYCDMWKDGFWYTHPFISKDNYCQHSLMVFPDSEIKIDCKDYVRVTSTCGAYYDRIIPQASYGEFKFEVWAKEKLIFETNPMKCDSACEYVDLDIRDYDTITLKTINIDIKGNKETNWGNLTFYKENGEKILVGEAENKNVFSFSYNGVSSNDFLNDWTKDWCEETLDNVKIYTVSYKDSVSGLKVICEIKHFLKYNVYWQKLFFENEGNENTGQISNISFVDLNVTSSTDVSVEYANGSNATEYDFMHKTEKLTGNLHLDTYGGRSSSRYLPYFRIDDVDSGYLCGIGWSGDWIADLTKTEKGVNIKSGLTDFDSYLKPREKICVGSFAIMEYKNSAQDAHNIWRRWMYEYNTPRINGEHFKVPLCYVPWGSTHEDVHAQHMDIMLKEKLKFDYYWIDAGWYGNIEGLSETCFDAGWGAETGNWYPNPGAYPGGMEKTSKKIHDSNMKMVMWLEPVRARNNTQIVNENPQYFYTLNSQKDEKVYDLLLNLSDDEATDFCIDFLDEKIKSYGIDCYEEDFNITPKEYWVQMDEENPSRKGMAEVKFVTNHWRFWDTIRERNPHIFIINCASGGRKLDLETVGRGIAIWRSDYGCYVNYDHSSIQNQSMSLYPWIPVHGAGIKTENGDMYDFRSSITAGSPFIKFVTDYDYDFERKILNEYHFLQKYLYGDYYKIISGGLDSSLWNAYEMNLPEECEGCVFAYRHEESPISEIAVELKGLEKGKIYTVRDLDREDTFELIGGEPFLLKTEEKRQAKIFVYKLK